MEKNRAELIKQILSKAEEMYKQGGHEKIPNEIYEYLYYKAYCFADEFMKEFERLLK